jgi:type II secretory pathway pseudopilin PulG
MKKIFYKFSFWSKLCSVDYNSFYNFYKFFMKKSIKAFTLIELLTIIAIIIILAFGVSNLNFKYISDRQNLEIATNSVMSKIESVMTSSLTWRAVLSGSTLVVPEMWKIEFNKNSWEISVSYTTDKDVKNSFESNANNLINRIDDIDWENYNETLTFNRIEETKLTNIECNPGYEVTNWVIIFKWIEARLTGECSENVNELELEFKYKNNFTRVLRFNAISWMIQ